MNYRLLSRLLLWLLCCVTFVTADAAETLLVGDSSRAYYNAFLQGFVEASHGVTVANMSVDAVGRASRQELARAEAIITLGSDAAQKVIDLRVSVPSIHTLVTAGFAEHAIAAQESNSSNSTFIVLEQPISRILALIRVALPQGRRLGVIYGPTSESRGPELRNQAKLYGYTLVETHIKSDAEVGEALRTLLGQVDALLALPDPVVVNENTAKSLILDTYIHEIALIGYSHALVKAGALMAIHSTPAQFGMQAAELAGRQQGNHPIQQPQLVRPRYYQVSVNYQVARALGLDLPSEDILQERVRQMEVAR